MEGSFDKVNRPIQVPSEEGKRRKVDLPQEPVHDAKRPGTFRNGWVDPRSHPFAPMIFPREFLQGSWVEPWRFDILSGYLPRREGILSGYRASAGPIRFAALVFPFAEAMGNRYSVKTFLRRSFPKAFPSTAPKGSFGEGVRDKSKGQIL